MITDDEETRINLNDNWYTAPYMGDPTTKQGCVDRFSFDLTTGLSATLLATYRGRDDRVFDLSVVTKEDHLTNEDESFLLINGPDRTMFYGKITESTPYGSGDEYDDKVVVMEVIADNEMKYKVTLDLNDGGMDFYIERVS